jgi:CBS domain-containing protein
VRGKPRVDWRYYWPDIVMAAYTQDKMLSAIPVSLAMAPGMKVCHPSDDIRIAEALARLKQVRRLPVVDNNGRVIGVISLKTFLGAGRAENAFLSQI